MDHENYVKDIRHMSDGYVLLYAHPILLTYDMYPVDTEKQT